MPRIIFTDPPQKDERLYNKLSSETVPEMEQSELADSFEESLRLNQSSDSPAGTAEELARFRREWEAEVKERKRHKEPSSSGSAAGFPIESNGSTSSQPNVSSRTLLVSSNKGTRRPLASSNDVPRSSSDVAAPTEAEDEDGTADSVPTPIRLMRRSVLFYAQAVEAERSGDLDKALDLYRKSFRLDGNADRLYERASNAVQAEIDSELEDIKARSDVLIQTEEVRQAIHRALDVEDYRYRAMLNQNERSLQSAAVAATAPTHDSNSKSTQASDQSRDELTALIDRLSAESGGERNFQQMQFAPEDEERPLPIATLPEEVLLHILTFIAAPKGRRGARIVKPEEAHHENAGADTEERASRKAVGVGVVLAGPDYMSIEALGRTCWRFRLLTRAWSVWRLIVRETYFPPQISPKVSLPALVGRHHNDWRTTFVDQPRVRLNGAFIAPCHYVREGMHEENVWVRVVHVVEFYRSLRFLPDGRALSLLTTDAPSQTVRRMEPSLRVKGFAIGTWTLYAQGLSDDDKHSRPTGPKIVVDNLQDKTMSRYSFRLILKLDKTSRGKWNRLEVLEYESVNLETGEVCPLPLNHKKPFHFSTVRSYGI